MKHVFPKLYGTSSAGKVKEWEIWVEDINGVPNIVNRHGYEDGKKQVNAKPIPVGKNIGKANETTPFQQACMDAESKWNLKRDKKYITERPTEHNQSETILPMLAHPFDKRGHDIIYPCYVQPKMNGVRCLAIVNDDKIVYQSRRGKVWETLSHLNDSLDIVPNGIVVDGEIYIHGEHFQRITSWSKKLRDETKLLEYWVYDLAIPDMTFEERHKMIIKLFGVASRGMVRVVPTYECKSEVEMKKYHTRFVKDGFEGVIIRNSNGLYRFDHRSPDLQKYKEFVDEEYKIVGGRAGTGIHEGCCIFECITPEGKQFSCYPKGTLEMRRQMYVALPELIGKELTIRYQEKSEDGVPIFPVGLAVRDYE